MMKLKFAVLVPLATLAGCAASSYCEGQLDYQTARSVPVPQAVQELRIPESENALRIPPPPENEVPYGDTVSREDGDEVVVCLDKPPDMPPLSELKEPPPAPGTEPAAPVEVQDIEHKVGPVFIP
jgi:hypothetical protein